MLFTALTYLALVAFVVTFGATVSALLCFVLGGRKRYSRADGAARVCAYIALSASLIMLLVFRVIAAGWVVNRQ